MGITIHGDLGEGIDRVEAALNYLAEGAEKPATYMYKPPSGTSRRNYGFTRYPMAIHDGRPLLDRLSLDREGFVLRRCDSAVANFYDPEEVRKVYFPEVERLVKDVTGAAKVLVFDHNVRCAPMARRHENGAYEPVKAVHNDYTVKSGPQRVRDLVAAEEAEALLMNRFAVINFWRPISRTVEEMPLAVCDAQTIAQADLVATELRYRDRSGEVYSVRFNPNHRWFYFPKMRADEVMLIKCYDSMDDGRARFTAHTAFEDPMSPPDAPARESIEVRTLAFFAPRNGERP